MRSAVTFGHAGPLQLDWDLLTLTALSRSLGYKEFVTVGPLILNRGTPMRAPPQKAPTGSHCAKVGVLHHHHAELMRCVVKSKLARRQLMQPYLLPLS